MHRALKVAAVLTVVGLLTATPTSIAAAAPRPPTQVTPKGDYVRLGLAGGKQFHADLNNGVVANCPTSNSVPTAPVGANVRNQIPTTNNPTTNGPVAFPLNPFTYTGCTSPSAGVDGVSVAATGEWNVSVQYSATALPVVRVIIPQNGLVVHADGANCTGTFAPNGPVLVIGRWRNGEPSRITVPNAAVPVKVTGSFVCLPADYTGSISFTYLVRNRTNPEAFVTVDTVN